MLSSLPLLLLITFFITIVICGGSGGTYPPIKFIGTIKVNSPSFLLISSDALVESTESSPALIISSFGVNPLLSHGVYAVADIGTHLNTLSTVTPKLIMNSSWPNVVSPVPPLLLLLLLDTIFNEKVLVVPSGFLVPGQETGAINLLPKPSVIKSSTPTQISVDKSGFFYHMVEWKDINNDGKVDIVSARANKPLIGSGSGELLWYEQPPANPLTTTWKPHHIVEGPDVFFKFYDVDGDGNEEIIAAQFFSPGLMLYYKAAGEQWSNATIKKVVIDTSIGALFDLCFADVNNDGAVELVVTNHVNNANQSGVYAYEIPKDYVTGAWKKHTLAQGFKTVATQTGSASPGVAVPFFPETKATNNKPLIVLAGDGAQAAYILSPSSQKITDWTYTVATIYNGTSTVGQIAVYDVDNDGFSEIFVPLYDSNEIQVFTFHDTK